MEPGTALLISQRLDGIDSDGSQRGRSGRHTGSGREQHGHRHERQRVERLHAEQEHRDDLPQTSGCRKANDGPERNDSRGAAKNLSLIHI